MTNKIYVLDTSVCLTDANSLLSFENIDIDISNIDIKDKAVFLKNIPLNRFGNPVDVSNLACFLSSDMSNYITGQTLKVDGGRSSV